MVSISNKIRTARPRLSTVSPLVFSITWGYAITNLFIAHSLLVSQQTGFILSNNLWSGVFAILSFGLAYSLVMNDWKKIKRFMVGALFVKIIWAFYLVAQSLNEASTTGVLGIWVFMAFVQAMTVVHFVPDGLGDGSLRKRH